MRRRSSWFMPLALLTFVCALAACGPGDGPGGKDADAAPDSTTAAEASVPVEVQAVARGPIEAVIRATSTLEAEERVIVSAEAARRVVEILAEEGDQVAKGALMLRLQDEEQESMLAKARTALETARREWERQQRLYDRELTTEKAYNDALANFEQRQIELQDAERELSYTRVRATIAGTVTQRFVKLGDQVSPGQQLFELIDFRSLQALVYVPEKELTRLEPGQPVRVRAPAIREEPYMATLQRVSPIVDARTGTVKATVDVGGQPGLRPGLYVDVELITEVREDALLVPKRALVYEDDRMTAYRVRSGVVERVPIVPAMSNDAFVLPAGGIAEGDTLVTAGQAGLKSGARVEIVTRETGSAMSDPRPRSQQSSFSTRRPVAITMLFVAAVVFGWFSLAKLPVNLMPELTYPTITVRTEYEGAAPEEVENDVSRPIEEALGVIGGLQRISSVSRAEVSDVVLEFDWDVDISDVTQDVLEKLDLVFLPDEAERPLILHFDPSLDPIMELSLSGEGAGWEGESGLRRARRLADLFVKRQLEPVRGVAAVRVKGGLEEEIHVALQEEQLERTRISIQQVIDRIAQENINVAGGTIEEGRTEFLVRTLNEYGDLGQIRDTIVTVIDGRPIRVRDLGEVAMAHKERQILTRTDGRESVQIEVYKEADANIVDLAARVKTLVGEVDRDREAADQGGRGGRGRGTAGLAQQVYDEEGAVLQVVADRSLFIESSIDEVRQTAILGGVLAVIVLFLFLREGRSTSIVAVSIPISLVMAFAPMNLFGVSLNIMSLGGLALGIGMLVDSSIVVLESIFRCREEGDDVVTAAVRGTDEVKGAVIASTLTTIAVFFPMVFVEGVAGQAFGDLGTAVVVSLIASVLVAIWFIPMLASRGARTPTVLGSAPVGESRRPRLIHFEMGRRFARSWREAGWFSRVVFAPWWCVRFVLQLVLHYTVALLLMLIVLLLGWSVRSLFLTRAGRLALGGLFLVGFAALLHRMAGVPLPVAAGVAVTIALAIGFRLVDVVMRWLDGVYPGVLRSALNQPLGVVVVVVLCFWGTVELAQRLDSELLPEVRQGEFTVEVMLPVGSPLEETERRLSAIESALNTEREHIRALVVTYGFDPAQSERSDEGEHTARFKVLLETGSGAEIEDQVVDRVRSRFEGVPDLDATITRPVLFSSKTPIEVEIHGDDLDALRDRTEGVRTVLDELPELADVQATLRAGAPELQVIYDRERLMRYGLDLGNVARLVRDKVQGNEATRFNRVDRRIPVLVQLSEEDRAAVSDIEEVVVNPGGERPIQLAAVAEVVMGEGPSEVRRIDGQRVGLVRANIEQGSLGSAVEAIRGTLQQRIEWPADQTFFISGQSEEWDRSQQSLILALGLSIFLVYVIMAVQFESLVHPLVILFSIPLAFFGSVIVLRALEIPISVVVFLGMIMLAGIVVNNAIVLVDYVNQLRRRGMPKREAIVTAGRVRLRPIFMTTATTVLGLLPMAVGLGDGAELRTPMAITVIAGLLSSTLLTLLVVPTLYSIFDRLAPVRADVETEAATGMRRGPTPTTSPGEATS